MRLSTLTVRHFRNLRDQDLELPPEGVALIGDNAQGKSNLLEAIYYLETFRSFRGAPDEQLVSFGADVFRLVGCAASDVAHGGAQVAAAYERRGGRKKVSIDGSEQERLGPALGRLAAVIFSPVDLELVSGGPKERRRFLDIVLSLNEPGYLTALQEYRRVLGQRNAALRDGLPLAAVSAWSPGLVDSGASVMHARRSWIEGVGAQWSDYYARVSNDGTAHMRYEPSVPLRASDGPTMTVPDIAEAFRAALEEASERDRRMGTTTVGPHRDEVALTLDREGAAVDLRDFGSGGQRRTAALALRLVEAVTIRDRRGETPLMLVDDAFAELDEGRSERVLELLEMDAGQVVLTAPKESDVRFRRHSLARWRIAAGRVST
ncbi:MAG: DNA replication/repair protein RecF [Gemmatimonadales bacterium]